MDSKALLLGAVCVLSLTAATSSSASILAQETSLQSAKPPAKSGDVLIEFLLGSGGLVSAQTVHAGLDAAFKSISEDNIGAIPQFLRDLNSLGVNPEVRETVEAGLGERILSSELPDYITFQAARSLIAFVGSSGASFQLAQLKTRSDCHDNSPGCRALNPGEGSPGGGAFRNGYQT